MSNKISNYFHSEEDLNNYLFGDPLWIKCLECGEYKAALGAHLRYHNMSGLEYKEKYGIPSKYGLVCKELSRTMKGNMEERINKDPQILEFLKTNYKARLEGYKKRKPKRITSLVTKKIMIAAAKKNMRTTEFYQDLVEKIKESKLTPHKYCKINGLSYIWLNRRMKEMGLGGLGDHFSYLYPSKNQDVIKKVKELYKNKYSQNEISRRLNIDRSTIRLILGLSPIPRTNKTLQKVVDDGVLK